MVRGDRLDLEQVPKAFAGRWIAWDRDRKRILGSGQSFDEAKQAAAASGESSVLMTKIPAERSPHRGRHWVYAVAVFISVLQGGASSLVADLGAMPSVAGSTASASPADDLADQSVDEDEDRAPDV